MIDFGYTRINTPNRPKVYASFVGRNYLKKLHRTATEAKTYAAKFLRRYESLRKCATG